MTHPAIPEGEKLAWEVRLFVECNANFVGAGCRISSGFTDNDTALGNDFLSGEVNSHVRSVDDDLGWIGFVDINNQVSTPTDRVAFLQELESLANPD